ncbi:MAG: CDP-glucose 4,6-dehydratase [Bdellovibrionota bacterium]
MTVNTSFWRGKRVLITGHTGFKGAWLSIWLEKMGAIPAGFSLTPSTNPNLFELTDLGKKIKSRIGDIRDFDVLKKFTEEFAPEITFHMAAQSLVRQSYREPIATYATNVMGTVHVLEALRTITSARVAVIVTSDKCYENKEWHWGYRESDPMGGHDPYSNSKGCAELVTSAYRRSFLTNIGLASARAGNVIGGGDWADDRLLPDCIRAFAKNETMKVRNPNSIRPWQHVLEPLSGYLMLAEKLWSDLKSYSQGWNFGPNTHDARSVSWVVDRAAAAWGHEARWELLQTHLDQPHEANYLKLDSSLANSIIGWKPRLSIDESLDWAVTWYRRVLLGGEKAMDVTHEQIEQYQNPA